MRKAGLDKFRALLNAKLVDLAANNGRRDEIAISRSAEPMDTVQAAEERELAISVLDQEVYLARETRAALGRVEDGTYGLCAQCGQDIPEKRLKAVPWADHCIFCQAVLDRYGHNGPVPARGAPALGAAA